MRLELVGDLAGGLRRGDDVAARDVDLVGQRQRLEYAARQRQAAGQPQPFAEASRGVG